MFFVAADTIKSYATFVVSGAAVITGCAGVLAVAASVACAAVTGVAVSLLSPSGQKRIARIAITNKMMMIAGQ
jgi:hypothetical protein